MKIINVFVFDCYSFDSEALIISGGVFDFATLHFQLSGQELFEKLNEVLHLRIGQENDFFRQSEVKIETPKVKPTPPVFSYFQKPVTNIVPTKEINLIAVYNLIQGNTFARCTNILRKIKDLKKARKYKASNFDYITFLGTLGMIKVLVKHLESSLKKPDQLE